ncbi:alpha-N-arabinofuranosidase [Microbacterium barkeri]|uniref:non-reducing end alpha-L-arabinofuranosidase n=2 Tax=Actinomycetes TaxID=1760 RepID=A0A9W6LY07_9MICO|nr:alpha-N-arabinofuranosidase [Microbacterium barkeri]ARJ31988.1 Abf51A [Corynebacterium alkanolyticum]MDR6878007.1 alpha-N-arabinofuranosidase [Microbacterium barkeri]GLJ63041.1 alpha-N-arabinofuranosidase [Microbacterium barkeri]
MTRARITIDRDFTIADVPRRLFGSFVEHMGRCVYTGIFEPGHPQADERGFRRDVLQLVKELGPTVVRYPGGNFVSGYLWEDGVGPVDQRPRRLDGAWHTIETNAFGLHEFVEWAGEAGVEVMEAVNLGTRGVEEARALVEYANHPGGTYWSDLRRRNGAADPFDIRLWCLGNELDGPWQIGHKTAHEYGRLAQETAKAMRLVDPTIELVAVGSSNRQMPTFGTWEHTVLTHAYEEVDYISMHAYYQERDGDAASFLAEGVDMDAFIDGVIATIDAVKAAGKHRKQVDISFDEWNVWDQDRYNDHEAREIEAAGWREHPRLIEDTYDVADAVVVGTLLHSLLRHGDRVRIANQAQLVNVIAPIRSEEGGPAWRQSIFWPFARMARLAQGRILRLAVDSSQTSTRKFGDVDAIDAAATWDEASGTIALFVANRSLEEAGDVTVDLRGLAATAIRSAEVLTVPEGGDRRSANVADDQDRVGLVPLRDAGIADGAVRATLPPMSWAVIVLDAATA